MYAQGLRPAASNLGSAYSKSPQEALERTMSPDSVAVCYGQAGPVERGTGDCTISYFYMALFGIFNLSCAWFCFSLIHRLCHREIRGNRPSKTGLEVFDVDRTSNARTMSFTKNGPARSRSMSLTRRTLSSLGSDIPFTRWLCNACKKCVKIPSRWAKKACTAYDKWYTCTSVGGNYFWMWEFWLLFTDIMQRGVIKVVSIINKIEIPSIPTL